MDLKGKVLNLSNYTIEIVTLEESCSLLGEVVIPFQKVKVEDGTKIDTYSELVQEGTDGVGESYSCEYSYKNEVVHTKDTIQVIEEPINQKTVVGTMDSYSYVVTSIVDLIDKGIAFDSGDYIKGDIPKGTYFFLGLGESRSYYSEKTTSGNIIDNENFDSFGYVYVHEAGNIETDGVLLPIEYIEEIGFKSGKEIYEAYTGQTNYMDEGFYKVGTDIPAGTYVFNAYGSGYVAILSGPIGNQDIIDNEIVDGRYQISVRNGQYLEVSTGYIE